MICLKKTPRRDRCRPFLPLSGWFELQKRQACTFRTSAGTSGGSIDRSRTGAALWTPLSGRGSPWVTGTLVSWGGRCKVLLVQRIRDQLSFPDIVASGGVEARKYPPLCSCRRVRFQIPGRPIEPLRPSFC